jgi:23S rRNA (uracil1939-C5)-methyltransferase
VLHPAVGTAIASLKALIESLSLRSKIPQIEVAVGDTHTSIVIRHLSDPDDRDLSLLRKFSEDFSLDIYLQGNRKEPVHVAPDEPARPLSYSLDAFDINMNFGPLDFTQVNFEINRKMVNQVITLLEPAKSESVMDLFCGIGNFTLPLARSARHATGIEGSLPLVEKARDNAEKNGIHNAEFHARDLYLENSGMNLLTNEVSKLLLDPPRSGAREVIENMDLSRIGRVVYVSCNPATLARDAGTLVRDKGYTLSKAGVIDMFPHTTHVESVAVFDKL